MSERFSRASSTRSENKSNEIIFASQGKVFTKVEYTADSFI